MKHMIPSRHDNPFASCWTRPGALAYQFTRGEGVDALVARLAASRWQGQIVGPHGSGKSTLLAALLPVICRAGRAVHCVELRDGQRRLPRELLGETCTDSALLVVDGYEQLSRWSRRRLSQRCHRTGCGLLVTAHRDCHLPTLAELSPSLPTVQTLVDRLSQNVPTAVTAGDVAASFHAHNGNVREIFFDLYDRHDQRALQRRTAATAISY